jgi:hypothetical protein
MKATVDHALMPGLVPPDRECIAELPRSRIERRIENPAVSGNEGSPDRDHASSLA